MSRLGDLILLERSRQNLTRKQVARKCGVSEGYLKDVEEGRRIIRDDEARRILRTLGASQQHASEFTLDEIAATVDLNTISPNSDVQRGDGETRRPSAPPKPEKSAKPVTPPSPEEQSGIWLDALSSVLKPVPVMNASWTAVSRRLVPIQDGKIEGANPDRVIYFLAPDDSMRAMRIEKGDYVLIVPQNLPTDGAVMLVEYGAHRCLRCVRMLGGASILLQSGDRDLDAQALHASEIKFIGRAVRVEFQL